MTEKHKSGLRALVDVARRHRSRVWLAASFSVINKVFDLAPPVLIGMAVDVVVERDGSFIAGLGVADLSHQLWLLALVTLAVWGLESAFEYAYAWMWRNIAQTLQHGLRIEAYAHVQRLEMAYFEDQSTGGLMAILNDDVNQLERFLDGGANDLIQVGTTVIVISAIFFFIAPSVAWMTLLPMPFVLWGSVYFQRLIAPRYALVRQRTGELNGLLANNLSGVATIKSFTSEAYEVDRVGRVSEAYRQANRRAIALSSAFSPLIRMVIVVGFVAILVYGGLLVIDGELGVGPYSVLVYLTQRLLWPLTRLGQTFDLYQRAMASTQRILSLLRTPVTIDGGGAPLDLDEVSGEIVFEGVNFGYGGREPIFEDFSLKIEAGQTVAIVGSTGSGKTSLINLLLRFYDVDGGRILLDGVDIRDLKLEDLRRSVGLVSQHVFLFHGKVSENIAYGSFDADEESIVAAGKASESHPFIKDLPEGYETVIGERGQKLSGGQRQRLSIARAILKDPPILVLDEATSAVDNETEAAIQRSMARVSAERTTLVIAHRLSTIRQADMIVVLDGGKVCESGTHDALVERGGVYAHLWRVQTGEECLPIGFVA